MRISESKHRKARAGLGVSRVGHKEPQFRICLRYPEFAPKSIREPQATYYL
jgi:hypothetical protein